MAAPADGADPAPSEQQHWYRKLGSPRHVLAPMVDQSECAYRVLCHRHNVGLCYSPMLSSKQFADSKLYRDSMFTDVDGTGEDRPLVVQFAGNDPQILLAAAKHVQHRCNAIDINFGCPQKIARRGHYGAWLLDEPKLMCELVSTLHCHLDCPVTAKIRRLPSRSSTVDLARALQGAGASVIAVHGRTREQKGALQGAADWDEIAAVKAAVSVPVFANGGIYSMRDVEACLAATGADGVMSGEGLLCNPALFDDTAAGDAPEELALEYIALQADYPSDLRSVKQHLFSLCYAGLQVYVDLRTSMHKARTLEEMHQIVLELRSRPRETRAPFCNAPGGGYTGWYKRHTWEETRRAAKQQAAEANAPAACDADGGDAGY